MTNNPRKPWVAGLLTFVTLGLGHIYGGQAKKGIIFYFISFFASLITAPFWLTKFFPINFIVLLIIGLAYFLYCLIDAVKISIENRYSYTLKSYNKWYLYFLVYLVNALVFSTIISFTIKGYVVQAFKIPSGAMIPTLLVGDRILADKHIYSNTDPARDDIVIFQYPLNPSQNFIKRVIGIEGDTIKIKDKRVYINNSLYEESYSVNLDKKTFPAHVSQRDNHGPITVPEGSIFVMGDNRDNSHDSRFWGLVKNESVIGKAETIYWSWDNESSEVRWTRINKKLN